MTLENRKQKTEIGLSDLRPPISGIRGYTLIELMVSIGLFSIVVLLTSGAYFMMISINRQAQNVSAGINNLSFVLDSMTRTIRTGTGYSGSSGSSFSFTPANAIGGATVQYARGSQQGPNGTVGAITKDGVTLTDSSVDVTSLMFYPSGTTPGDSYQPHVTIVVKGIVTYGPGLDKKKDIVVETGATMRGTDI